jgi:glycosyltransferase involved in cell wall biosynthesis
MQTPRTSPALADVSVFVFGDRYRAGRTIGALRRRGALPEEVCGLSAAALAATLLAVPGPVWLVRAGAWLAHPDPITLPPPSATGRPLCALGLVRPEPGQAVRAGVQQQWAALQAETGGDFGRAAELAGRLPPIASVYLEADPTAKLAQRLARGAELDTALPTVLGGGLFRVVHYPPLDVHHDAALRVVQVVTSLQQGGAERVALDLASALEEYGIRSLLLALYQPTRTTFAVPAGAIDLSRRKGNRQKRWEAARQAIHAFAADLVHGHLFDVDDIGQLGALGLPLVLTIYNTKPGWPRGLETLSAAGATLLLACAQAVEADLRVSRIPVPVRTMWNGVDFTPFERTPALRAAAQALRQRLGFGPEDFVLLALANPRPQKRLDRLPAVLAATRAELARQGIHREARLVFAGETSRVSEAAAHAEAAMHAAVACLGLRAHIRFLGPVDAVAPLLVAADVLVSSSAYEGLSLAHLEALAADLPVVATAAGGTPELAQDNPALCVLPLDAGPDHFAEILAALAQTPARGGRSAAAVHFTRARMIERHMQLYPRALAAARGPRRGSGLLLVINNFVTGGAQSSARRLLLGLAAEGIRVRAAVLEEEPAQPTPGRCALVTAGIPVLALPRAGTIDAARAVADLLERIDADPPEAVLLWNALAEYKLLLADGLLDIPLYDVSPGEMYYTSLERYFKRPRPGLPYRTGTDYGARLAGVIVKYRTEADRAARTLGTSVHVIPNGVPLDGAPRSQRPPGTRLVLGTVARIAPQKKLEELLAALHGIQEHLPPHLLRIAGGVERGCSAYAAELHRLAEGLAVEWVGELHDVRPFLEELDLFVLVAEPAGCPNASLEAMAASCAVVVTNVGGVAEQIDDGVTGRLVPRGNAEALGAALVELAWDPARRACWGAAGRARVKALFDQKRMVADYRRICLAGSYSCNVSPRV